ncbi:hypothetical protein BJV82DRAFT_598236 [Fennellomyces sp. T-0311]|nr:hypothetical protein BJV82DRAFT_598236 [Fennellomyces sp. T-0311]
MARTPSPPETPRSSFEHPDRARMISSSRSSSPQRRSRSPDRYRSGSTKDYHRRRTSSRDAYAAYELPTLPIMPAKAITGTNTTPILPRGTRAPDSVRASESASSSTMNVSLHTMPTVKSYVPPKLNGGSSMATPPQQSNTDKKKKRLKEYLNGPADPPADVIVWTGVSARNQTERSNFYTGAYAIVWEKGNYRNEVQTFHGRGKSNVYAEFAAVHEVLQICRNNECILIKTTSSEVINAIQNKMNTEFWEEVARVRTSLRRLVKSRTGRVIFKKVPSRVGLPHNDQACAMADKARKELEASGTISRPSVTPVLSQESMPPLPPRIEMPGLPKRKLMPEEKAQEFLEDFHAFLRGKALASLHTSTDVDEDGHPRKTRKLSHPSQRDPRITGGQVAQSSLQQDVLLPPQVSSGVQNIIRPEQSAAAASRSLSVTSNDLAQRSQPQQDESDDEYFDAIDYWVDPNVKRIMDKPDVPKAASTLSWISKLSEE